MPLSDMHHGPYCMMPPELLHASQGGLIKYLFQSMQFYIGATKLRDELDKMHIRMLFDVRRQSDRDFPRGSMRNGIIDDTKCQPEEQKVTYFCCCALVALHWVVRSCKLHYDTMIQPGRSGWGLSSCTYQWKNGFTIQILRRK